MIPDRMRGSAVVAVGVVAVLAATTSCAAAPGPAVPRPVELAPIVAAWPEEYRVSGTKSEPLYVEHIRLDRDGDRFALRIDVRSQGSAELGVQRTEVEVGADGRQHRLTPCPEEAAVCDPADPVRGLLSTATLLAAARQGRLPEHGVLRDHAGRALVCVDDAELFGAPGVAGVDPCFSVETGAVLAHWSEASRSFAAATLDPDLVESAGGAVVASAPTS